MRVDAHHHLWRYNTEEFGWIGDEAAILRRDFDVAALEEVMAEAHVDAAVAVQARCSVEETRWLLRCAAASTRIRRVVGWAPLLSGTLPAFLEEMTGEERLSGFREIAQEQPKGFFLQPALNAGIHHLTARNYTYDILIRARQMEEVIRFVDLHPDQDFVLDHAGKPDIAHAQWEPWRAQLTELARRPRVRCKLSGMVTEANWQRWTEAEITPYLDACLEVFGPARCMVGSDWPVCLVASSYRRWWHLLERWASRLSAPEQGLILGGTAASFYGMEPAARDLLRSAS